MHLTGTNHCVQRPGLTGPGCLQMGWKCWFNIWATCPTSTKWDGEDAAEATQQTHVRSGLHSRVFFSTAPKYSSVTPGRCTRQRMRSRNANTSWVSGNPFLLIVKQVTIEPDGLNLQQRDSKPSTKDTERTANSRNRRKQVNVTKHSVATANPAVSASAGGSQVVFFRLQPQRLNPVGEERKRGRRGRGEPGLSKSSGSKESSAGHATVHHSAPLSGSIRVFFNPQVHQGLHEPRSGENHRQLRVPGLCQAELPEQAQGEPAKDRSGQNNLVTSSSRAR